MGGRGKTDDLGLGRRTRQGLNPLVSTTVGTFTVISPGLIVLKYMTKCRIYDIVNVVLITGDIF